jgi:hypothetical protein
MAGGYKSGLKVRDREALTAERALRRPDREDNLGYVNAELKDREPWILFYDKYFDRDLNRGEGPCALACSPDQTKRAKVSIQNYGCHVWLTYPVDAPSHIAVWDLKGMGNKAATEYMKALEIE